MPYTQLFYHLIWTTEGRQPILTGQVEQSVHNLIRSKAIKLGATVFALDGVADHVHLAVSIPPALSVSDFVGQVKGASSAMFNQTGLIRERFYWQSEYGAFSFDRKRLPNVVAYIEGQKSHHADRTTIAVLERTSLDSGEVREPGSGYGVDDESWRRELLELE